MGTRGAPTRRDEITAHFPELVHETFAAAQRLMEHRFDLLGSGPVSLADPARGSQASYVPLDWRVDPRAGVRFPNDVERGSWTPAMIPVGADIKFPWEVGRCQHFAVLAQAAVLSGDTRFAREIVAQCADFIAANPPGIGVQWLCTMDVSLRAISWSLAFDMLGECGAVGDTDLRPLYAALFDHGVFIRAHLENQYEVTSNHFLSNIVALLFLGTVFRTTPEAQGWTAFATGALEEEIVKQVLPDGADFESSLPYHRLVTELFLSALRQADISGILLSTRYRQTAEAMVDFLVNVLRPDGLMPQIGDADDGRAHIFTRYGFWNPQDPRHLLGPAARMFGRPEWTACAGKEGAWEAAWWGFDRISNPAGPSRLPDIARLMPAAGLAVGRTRGMYLIITNGIVGTNGFGNHKHNDQLSFEYHLEGIPVFVDPGSYVYTSDPEARNQFRSTHSHNTVEIDGSEQNEFNREWLFRMFETARPEHLFFSPEGPFIYEGLHHGYERLADPVLHRRRFELDTQTGVLRIEDVLSGTGSHQLVWAFHCGRTVGPSLVDRSVVLAGDGLTVRLDFDRRLSYRFRDGWYSPSYGVRLPIRVVEFTANVDLSEGSSTFRFSTVRP